jgi:hypothetical protein
MGCTANSFFNRVMFRHQGDCLVEITVADVAVSKRPIPEGAFTFGAAPE